AAHNRKPDLLHQVIGRGLVLHVAAKKAKYPQFMPPIQEFKRGGLAAPEAQHQVLVSLLCQVHSPHYQPPGGSGTYRCMGESWKGLGRCQAGRVGTTPIATKFS